MALTAGVWKVIVTDDYKPGESTQIWKLTQTGEKQFKVERRSLSHGWIEVMGDRKLVWNEEAEHWFMYTFQSILRIKSYEKTNV